MPDESKMQRIITCLNGKSFGEDFPEEKGLLLIDWSCDQQWRRFIYSNSRGRLLPDAGWTHVLKAMGCSDEAATGSIRFSLGRFTTEEEIGFAVEAMRKVLA